MDAPKLATEKLTQTVSGKNGPVIVGVVFNFDI